MHIWHTNKFIKNTMSNTVPVKKGTLLLNHENWLDTGQY